MKIWKLETFNLIVGAIKKKEDFVGDSELCKPTEAYYRHTEIIKTIKRRDSWKEIFIDAVFFLFLLMDMLGLILMKVHIILTRDRYHISIAGTISVLCW
jgi:hypothetical protein